MTTTTAPETRYLDRPDGRIAYEERGAGPLVLLVPGMGELRASYRFLAPLLAEAGYRVVSTDLRGHGDSGTTFTSYGDVATASDVAALVEALGGPAVVVGNSLAAGAAVIAATDHPDLVAGLVLLGPFVRNPTVRRSAALLFRAMTVPLWIAAAWRAYMPSLYAGRPPVDFDAYRRAVHAALRRPGYAEAFSRTARETDHAPAEARLDAVTAPVLVVMGARDPDFPDPTAEAHWIGERLHAPVVVVPEAGHYPQAQRPDLTGAAVLDFLATVRPRG